MKTLRNLLFTVLVALTALTASAQNQIATTLIVNVKSNLLTVPAIIDTMTFTAGATTDATIKFYDSASLTNIGLASYITYATSNYTSTVTFTNESSIIITNTYTGIYTYPVTNAAATNSIATLVTMVVPAGTQRTRAIRFQVSRGLTAVSSGNGGIIEVSYYNNP